MFDTMRRVFGPVAVTTIIGAIALVFIFYGVFNPRGSRGLRSGGSAATVNGETISLQEFSREYQQRVDFYSNMMKGKADPKLLAQLGLKNQVIEELVRRKLLLQEAERLGIRVSDDEVRGKIQELPYFQKDGRFDAVQYKKILEANRYQPSTFEESIRSDLKRNKLLEIVRGRSLVSDKEIEKEFLVAKDLRQVDYAYVSRDVAKKRIAVSDKEVEELLKSEAGKNSAKAYYEQHRMEYVKKPAVKPDPKKKDDHGKPAEFFAFEDVQRKVAVEVLKDKRSEEITKITREIATGLFEKAKKSEGELRAAAKAAGVEVKTSDKFNRNQRGLPGVGEAADLVADAFKEQSPLATAPKMYDMRGGFVVAMGLKATKPDLSELNKDRDNILAQLNSRKEQALFEQWMNDVRKNSKVVVNESLSQIEAGAAEE